MLLVDSSVWIDYFNGRSTEQTDYLHDMLGQRPIVVGDIILAEILQGFRDDTSFALARKALQSCFLVEMVGIDLAIRSAEYYRQLRRRGVTVRKTIDCLIATYAIVHTHELLHADRDFEPFETFLGLSVIHPENLKNCYPS